MKLPVVLPLLFLVTFVDTFLSDPLCPPGTDILPCECSKSSGQIMISCMSPFVTQQSIDNLFSALTFVNGNPLEGLFIQDFLLVGSNVTTFDLSPLANMDFVSLGFFKNPVLENIIGRSNSTAGEDDLDLTPWKFGVEHLFAFDSGLRDESVATVLKYIDLDKLKTIELTQNEIQGSDESDLEFISGLSACVNLEKFKIGKNKVRKIGGGQFRNNSRLTLIDLSGNLLGRVGKDAFFMEGYPEMIGVSMEIDLRECELTDGKFGEDTGLEFMIDRPTRLRLDGNKFDFLSRQKFEGFLMANPLNEMRLENCPIFCDSKLKWLKDQSDLFENRVIAAFCVNDPGQTVFTTDLI